MTDHEKEIEDLKKKLQQEIKAHICTAKNYQALRRLYRKATDHDYEWKD